MKFIADIAVTSYKNSYQIWMNQFSFKFYDFMALAFVIGGIGGGGGVV